MRSSLKKLSLLFGAALIAAPILFQLSQPYLPNRPQPRPPEGQLVASLDGLEDWLARRETGLEIKPGQESKIFWPARVNRSASVEQALLYLHGFSASPHDTDPLIRNLSEQLAIPVVYQRFTGHGLKDGSELGNATAQDWVDDTLAGLEVARVLAKRTIVVAMSTGVLPILQIVAEQPEWAAQVSHLVLLSPNFAPHSRLAQLVTGPFGPSLARLIRGPENRFTPRSEGHAERWTTAYPWEAVRSVMDLVNTVSGLRLESIPERGVRVQCLYISTDTVVRADLIPVRCQEMGAQVADLPEATDHELTGEALALVANEPQIRRRIMRFLSQE